MSNKTPSEISVAACMGAAMAAWLAIYLVPDIFDSLKSCLSEALAKCSLRA